MVSTAQTIPPANLLTEALSSWISNGVSDGLYIVSMDHAPSEQLTGLGWHTTVLVLSPAVEHAELAQRLGSRLKPRNPGLSKWVNATRAYRQAFLSRFTSELEQFPGVAVLAVSATEATIEASLPHFISNLGLETHYSRMGNGHVSLGPFVRGSDREERTVQLSEKRAAMCLFIAHFVRRMHAQMYEAANRDCLDDPGHMNWNFYGDKFPGPRNGDMELMFQVLMGVDRSRGRIQWGYFTEGGQQEIDLLVDNLAGALNVAVERSYSPQGKGGLFYWERWSGPIRIPLK